MTRLSREDRGRIRKLVASKLVDHIAVQPPKDWGRRADEWRAYVEEIARQISPNGES